MRVDGFGDDALFRIAWGLDAGAVRFGALTGGLYDPDSPAVRNFIPADSRDVFGIWVQLPDAQIVYSNPADNGGYSIPFFDAFTYRGEGKLAVRSDYVSGDVGIIQLQNVEPVSSISTAALLLAGAVAARAARWLRGNS